MVAIIKIIINSGECEMIEGHRTWLFKTKPVIIASAAVGGPFEARGNLAQDFDILHDDIWAGQVSFEKAEKVMLEEACETAIHKAGLKKENVGFFLAGDLMNQIISSSFVARTLSIPYLGIYGACSSAAEGLALASLIVDCKFEIMCWQGHPATMALLKNSIVIQPNTVRKTSYSPNGRLPGRVQ